MVLVGRKCGAALADRGSEYATALPRGSIARACVGVWGLRSDTCPSEDYKERSFSTTYRMISAVLLIDSFLRMRAR